MISRMRFLFIFLVLSASFHFSVSSENVVDLDHDYLASLSPKIDASFEIHSKKRIRKNKNSNPPDVGEIGKSSNNNLKTYRKMLKDGYTKESAVAYLQNHRPDICKLKIESCPTGDYWRSINGTCNNLKHPLQGASYTSFKRIHPAAYKDGLDEPRGGIKRSSLPNARLVSSSIHHDRIVSDAYLTSMVAQFGQFLDHDMTFAPEASKQCCTTDAQDVDCFAIKVFRSDKFYASRNPPQKCIRFTRSTPFCFPNSGGRVEREQMNLLTAYIDASNVYGNEDQRARQLREGQGGRLRVNGDNKLLLPTVDQVRTATNSKIDFAGTFFAGDDRTNVSPSSVVLHNLFVREHNRIAEELEKAFSGQIDDETLYQETRRIVIAEMQNIVYGEYLPVILGSTTMRRYSLTLGRSRGKYHSKYDDNLDASILHAFSTAAYRFGHTLISGLNQLMKNLVQCGSFDLRDNFFNANQVLVGGGDGYNRILEGVVNQPAQAYDNFVSEDLGNFLFKKKEDDFGSDLIARNIQRGRDHGLPSYNEFRKHCGFPSLPRHFSSEPSEPRFRNETWAQFRRLYASPADIDLFSGGLAEIRESGAVTGPTFNCIKAIQFHLAKSGDRFFFTHERGASNGFFTEKQLAHIRKRKFSDIICDNSNLEYIPMNVFTEVTGRNRRMSCNPGKTRDRVLLKPTLLIANRGSRNRKPK